VGLPSVWQGLQSAKSAGGADGVTGGVVRGVLCVWEIGKT
jgi:hypothetical protein